MRPARALAFLLLVLAAPAAAHVSGVHSPNVVDAHHEPLDPGRGEPVQLTVFLNDTPDVESVKAIYCRVQAYACGPALNMTPDGGERYSAQIPWEGRFFRGVTQVGYKFEIRHENGSAEHSPVVHYPERPADLPQDADIYYYYALEPEASPLPAWVALLVAPVAVLLAWRRRR